MLSVIEITMYDYSLMRDYFIRRLLLIPPTLFGISVLVFADTRLAPGGPLEQAMMQMQQVSQDGGGGRVWVRISLCPRIRWNR